MHGNDLSRRIAAELVGTALLLATVVGSGIRPADAPAFIVAQCLGAVLAAAALSWLLHPKGYPEAGASRQKQASAKE